MKMPVIEKKSYQMSTHQRIIQTCIYYGLHVRVYSTSAHREPAMSQQSTGVATDKDKKVM